MEIYCTACEMPIEISPAQMSNWATTVPCTCGQEVTIAQSRPVAPVLRLASTSEAQVSPPTAESPPVQESSPQPPAPGTVATPRPRPNIGTPRVAPRVTPLATAAPPTIARPGSWRSCVNHPRVRSEEICPVCAVGYCVECKKAVCPKCDGGCMPTREYAAWQTQERQRARPLTDDLATILSCPLQDRLAFLLLALFTGLFGFAARFTVYALPFSQGVLLWYSFHSLYQVAKGNMRHAMPEFHDISDLYRPLRLSAGVLLIGWAPALLLMAALGSSMGLGGLIWGPTEGSTATVDQPVQTERDAEQGVAITGLLEVLKKNAGEGEGAFAPEREEEASSMVRTAEVPQSRATTTAAATEYTFGLSLLIGLALAWKVAYTPVALIVAALSHNLWSIMNPLIGADTIRRMGPVYMQAMLIYTGLAAARWVLGAALGYVPLAGGVVMSFVDAYFYLVIGCLLGLAVFKRAKELGWD